MKDENEVTGYVVDIDKFNRFEQLYHENENVRSVRKLMVLCQLENKTVQKYLKIIRWYSNN